MRENMSNVVCQYYIGDCIYTHNELEIRRHGKTVKLSAKVGELLLLFIQNSNNVLEFSEAIRIVWDNNEGVGRKGYTNAVWMIRKSFKELGLEDNIFESIPKVGYKFLPAVKEVGLAKKKSQPQLSINIITLIIISSLLLIIFYHSPALFDLEKQQVSKEKVTNYEGVEEHIAISPNGNYIAFSWAQQSQAQQVYIKSLNNLSDLNDNNLSLISSRKGDNVSPAWAPSENSLAYINSINSQECLLIVKDLLVKSEKVLSNSCYYVPYYRVLSWSSTDENSLVYSKNLGDRVAIYHIDISTNVETQKTFPKAGEVDYLPRLNSKELYFIRDHQKDYDFSLLKIDNENKENKFDGSFVGIVDFDVSNIDNKIYINMSVDSEHKIYITDENGKIEDTILTSALPSSLDYSEILNSIFISEHISREYIALTTIKDGKINRKISSSSRDLYGSFITQENEIVFLSNRDKNWAIWKSGVSGSTNLTGKLGDASIPRVSPDGKHIVVRIKDEFNINALYLIDELNNVNKIDLKEFSFQYANWSTDSQHIYFSAIKDGKLGLFSYNMSSKNVSRLTNSGELYTAPIDQNNLLVSRQNMDGLWIYNLINNDFTLLTKKLASFDFGSFFSLDNNTYFLNRTTEEDQIVRINDSLEQNIVLSYPKNSIKKYFGISPANHDSFLVTFKIANEADISIIGTN